MSGLPKLPGLTFSDPTFSRYHLSQTFGVCNGYKIPKNRFIGIGERQLESNSVKYITTQDPVRFDPSLTYGRTTSQALPLFRPHYVLYDKKCLTFRAFFKQSVVESPNEYYRVRQVNLIYFLEDDTITVIEPRTLNSGMDQGKLVRRGKIPKTTAGDYWHWKDLAVGKDIALNGVVYHTVDCDLFTREYMASQGLVMGDPEQMPADPYTQSRLSMTQSHFTKTPPADDKFRRFLEYDGKILKFNSLWDDRDSEYGEMRKCEILYFLSDDTIAVKEIHGKNDGRDPFPQLLRKTKLPKIWTDVPASFPSIVLEKSDDEVTEFYQPKDLKIGETIFVLGRKMLLYDCDEFTRNYYTKALCIEQGPAMDIRDKLKSKKGTERPMPPHDGLGSLEDSLQNTLTFLPKPPKKDVIKQILNANKYLRYQMVMDDIHPEDTIRKFLLLYSLGDSTCKIHEPPIRNSGILGGKFLRSTLLIKPGSDKLNPNYYSPVDFYIGSVITVFEHRFKIVGADLYVYRYMQENSEKFPCQVIENIRNYMFKEGYLNEDLQKQIEANRIEEKKAERDTIGKELIYTKTDMEKCLDSFNIKPIDENFYPSEFKKEPNVIPDHNISPYGIQEVNLECPYPPNLPPLKDSECKSEDEKLKMSEYDTPEQKLQKYYDQILRTEKEVCEKAEKDMEEKLQQSPEPKQKTVTFAKNLSCECD